MGRLGWIGLERPLRYECGRPGELVHVDAKKLGRTEGGAGKRVRGGPTRTTTAPLPTAPARDATRSAGRTSTSPPTTTAVSPTEVLNDHKATTTTAAASAPPSRRLRPAASDRRRTDPDRQRPPAITPPATHSPAEHSGSITAAHAPKTNRKAETSPTVICEHGENRHCSHAIERRLIPQSRDRTTRPATGRDLFGAHAQCRVLPTGHL
jgi:hypothetical protein